LNELPELELADPLLELPRLKVYRFEPPFPPYSDGQTIRDIATK